MIPASIQPVQGGIDLPAGDAELSLEAVKDYLKGLFADFPVAARFRLGEERQDSEPLVGENGVPNSEAVRAVRRLFETVQKISDLAAGDACALHGNLNQVNLPELIVLHGGKPAWSVQHGQAGKGAA